MPSLSFRWTDDTRAWIDQLDTLPRRLFHGLQLPVQRALRQVIDAARGEMPIFEFDMFKDLHLMGVQVGDNFIVGRVGFTDATVMPPEESVDGPVPFHYPWGKHDGIEKHKVWLWSRATGRGRAKLIRWAQAAGAIPADVPETGDEESIREALGDSPPFLFVAPDSTPFLSNALETVADRLMGKVGDRLGLMWSGRD